MVYVERQQRFGLYRLDLGRAADDGRAAERAFAGVVFGLELKAGAAAVAMDIGGGSFSAVFSHPFQSLPQIIFLDSARAQFYAVFRAAMLADQGFGARRVFEHRAALPARKL